MEDNLNTEVETGTIKKKVRKAFRYAALSLLGAAAIGVTVNKFRSNDSE